MLTLELNKKKYKLPTEWIDITLGKYLDICSIDNMEDEITKTVLIINKLSGIKLDDLLELPISDYDNLLDAIGFINSEIPDKLTDSWTYDNITYQLKTEFSKYTANEILQIHNLINDDINNLPTLLALVYKPNIEPNKDEDQILKRSVLFYDHMPMSNVLSTQIFLQTLQNLLIQKN